jgi:hypothetical protein
MTKSSKIISLVFLLFFAVLIFLTTPLFPNGACEELNKGAKGKVELNSNQTMKTDITITAAAIATLISALTSACMTLWLTTTNKKKSLDDQLDAILKIAIQYPYLESDAFAVEWKADFNKDDEKYLRYDVYCNLLFNFLSRVASYYKYDKVKIENYIAIKDWVRLHGKCWKNPTSAYENVDSYEKKFVDFINSYLK